MIVMSRIYRLLIERGPGNAKTPAMVHARFGFFMNWSGAQKGEGFEYHLLVVAAAAVVMLRGSGALSLDRLFSRPEPLPSVVFALEAEPQRRAPRSAPAR